mmetsp:Transcript_6430/g.17228  ORF Transcript_6430/g.17228 Transcript_6430/m.17228 type:complete len:150 (+) Transcript_6430:70-519(+)
MYEEVVRGRIRLNKTRKSTRSVHSDSFDGGVAQKPIDKRKGEHVASGMKDCDNMASKKRSHEEHEALLQARIEVEKGDEKLREQQVTADGVEDGRTEAEKRFDERQSAREKQKLRILAAKSYRAQVEDFNTKLARAPAHFDVPKISHTK